MSASDTRRLYAAINGGAARAFSYDGRGNVASNGLTGFTYDFANQPVTLTGAGAGTFAYDANLKRVKSVSGGKTVYTVYSRVTGGLIYRDEATDGKTTDYASLGHIGVRLGNAATPIFTDADALGSPASATDASGNLLWRQSYMPFDE